MNIGLVENCLGKYQNGWQILTKNLEKAVKAIR
jgi:hypothetical protein